MPIDRTVPIMIHSLMKPGLKRLPAHFFRLDSGREPVREWLKKLNLEDRKIIGEDIKDVEFAWPIGMPLVRGLGDGLWEVRSSLTGGKIVSGDPEDGEGASACIDSVPLVACSSFSIHGINCFFRRCS